MKTTLKFSVLVLLVTTMLSGCIWWDGGRRDDRGGGRGGELDEDICEELSRNRRDLYIMVGTPYTADFRAYKVCSASRTGRLNRDFV